VPEEAASEDPVPDASAPDESTTDSAAPADEAPASGAEDEEADASGGEQQFTPPDEVTATDEAEVSDPTDDDPAEADADAGPPKPPPRGDDPSEADAGTPPDDAPAGDDEEDATVEYDDLFGAPALGGDPSSGGDGASGGGASSTDADATGDASSSEGTAPSGDGPQAVVAEPDVAADTGDVDVLAEQWPQFVSDVKGDRISLGALLGETEPVALDRGELTVEVPKALHRESLRDETTFLLRRLGARFEADIDEVRFVVQESSPTDTDTADAGDDPMSPREQLQALRDTYPALDILFEEFGAEPVW